MITLTALTLLALSSAHAASIKLQSREYIENKKGEIIEVDATIVNSKGEKVKESEATLASIRGSKESFISTQHVLIPATSEVRQALLAASGSLSVEGSILDEKTSLRENTSFKEIKVLVREVE
jgi:hypothetical protein